MLPFHPAGTLLRLLPAPAEGRLFGRLVLLPPGKGRARPVLHRVIFDGGRYVVTRGDASAVDDPPVSRDALLGVADAAVAGPCPRLSCLALRSPRLFGALAFALRPLACALARLDETFHRLRGR